MENIGRDVRTVGVIGAGQMGRGIAQVAAQVGYRVQLVDQDIAVARTSLEVMASQLNRLVDKGKLASTAATEAMGRVEALGSLAALGTADLVIEAVSENKQLKFKIFRELDEVCPEHTILASNTSSISITEIAAVTRRPDRVCGMHFMNPVPLMKLVEGIRALQTDPRTFEVVQGVAERMGKVFVVAEDVPGFAVNRILMPMINEAVFSLQEGLASARDIDLAMKLGTNQPMGPLELADFIGLDTCLAILEVMHSGLGDPKYRPCPLLRKYVSAGWLGKKSGKGFHTYGQ